MRIHRNPRDSIHGGAIHFYGRFGFAEYTAIAQMQDYVFRRILYAHVRGVARPDQQIAIVELSLEKSRARAERAANELRDLGADSHLIEAVERTQEELSAAVGRL